VKAQAKAKLDDAKVQAQAKLEDPRAKPVAIAGGLVGLLVLWRLLRR
jgi:hypothetical protein